MGWQAHFLFVMSHRDLRALLETAISGLGYELADLELPGHGALIRVFIDRPGGVNVDDCAAVSNHLTRLFAVEQIDYSRLEVTSPGLDRRLREASDFRRFQGQRAQIRLRVPLQGRRNFVESLITKVVSNEGAGSQHGPTDLAPRGCPGGARNRGGRLAALWR